MTHLHPLVKGITHSLIYMNTHDLSRPWHWDAEAIVGDIQAVSTRVEGHGRGKVQTRGYRGEGAIGIDPHHLA